MPKKETEPEKRLRLTPTTVKLFGVGWTITEIATELRVSRHAVTNWLDKAGVARTKRALLPPTATNEERLAFGAGQQDPETGCIPWTRYTSKDGYGQLRPQDERGHVGAHQLSLELKLGRRLVEGEVSRHICDNPPCVNKNHLEVGSHQDNSDDMVRRGRSRGLPK